MNAFAAVAVGQSVLGVLLLLSAGWSASARHGVVRFTATIGVASSVALYAIEDRWRTVDLSRPEARIAAVGVGAAWLIVLVADKGRGDWRTGALIGCASTGLLIAAPNRWLVPMLVFWACSTFAMAVALREARPASLGWFALVAGDALMIAALVSAAQESQVWARPEALEGWHLWAVAAGAVLRAGALPVTGVWGALETPAAPVLPLLVAGAFALPLPSLTAQPWASVALLVLTLALAAGSLRQSRLRIGIVAAWPVALGLAAAFAASRAEAAAGIQATLACAAVALWPWTLGRGQIERGLLVSFLPLTAGFAAVALATTTAFESASRVSGLASFLPWALVVGLLPVAQLAGVMLAARVGAGAEPEGFEPSAVLGLWGLLAACVVVGVLVPEDGAGGGGSVLRLGALGGAVVAAALARRGSPAPTARSEAVAYTHAPIRPRPAIGRSVSVATLLVGLAAGALVVWFTVEGLRLGFLPG